MNDFYKKTVIKKIFKGAYFWFFIIAFITVLIQNYIGVKFSYDSSWYIIFANRISESLDFTRHAVYAPLYSWSLGVLGFIGLDILASILVYFWFSFLLILVVFYFQTRSAVYAILGFIAVLSNLSTASLFTFALTELGYSALLICAVLSLYKLINSENKTYRIVFLVSLALLPIQRYIGGFLAAYLGLIYLFLFRKNIVPRILELFICTIPTILVITWNFVISGRYSGDRKDSVISFLENTIESLKVLYRNFGPEWLLFLIAIVIIFYFVSKKEKPVVLFVLFLTPFIQVLAQLYGSSTYFLYRSQPRFFVVLTPLMVLLIMIFLKEIFNNKKRYYRYSFISVFSVLIFTNLFGLNKRHKTVDDIPLPSYTKVREYISMIPLAETIGVYSKNTECRQAEFILTARIIPEGFCKDYRVLGDNRTNDINYVPVCDNLNGHKYIPVFNSSKEIPNYIIIDKHRLKDGTEAIFGNFEVKDLGSFYGLTKQN